MKITVHTAPSLSVVDGIPTTTSNQIAEYFGKQHQHVMERIRALTSETPEEFGQSNFRPAECIDEQGKPRPCYRLTRDGFTLLAMGFTGKKALAFKLAYIDAFNRMEEQLRSGGGKDAGRCMEQAASIVSKIQMDLYKTLLSGRRGHYPRYLLSLDGHSTVVPVPHDAIVASLKDLPGMITNPGCISASKDDLTKVAHACLQVMSARLPSHT